MIIKTLLLDFNIYTNFQLTDLNSYVVIKVLLQGAVVLKMFVIFLKLNLTILFKQ